MLDRAIGVIGVALALIFGLWSLAPEGWPKMPPWLMYVGISLGIFLIGLAGGLIISEYREPSEAENKSKRHFDFDMTPPNALVEKKRFANERVPLDGYIYRDCTFENVTFVYNGTRGVELSGNRLVGKQRIASDNPSIDITILLLRGLGGLSETFEVRLAPGQRIEPPRRGQGPPP